MAVTKLDPVRNFALASIVVSIIFSVLYFSLPLAAGTAEADARMRQEDSDKLSANIRSIAIFGLAPIITGGASIFTIAKIKKASVESFR